MTEIYFIRHAQPNFENRNDLERELSPQGMRDRSLATAYLMERPVDAVYSSPFRRAVDTVQEFAGLRGLPVQTLEGFRERRVASGWIQDFSAFARRQWADFSYRLPGGECLREVQERNLAALRQVLRDCAGGSAAIGSHGTALSTIVNFFDPSFGFEDFQRIKNKMPWAVHFSFAGEECAGLEEIDLFTHTIVRRR